MKRVKKAKADGTDGVAGSDDNLNGESLTGGQSVLEISGPTIPSPGPSGVTQRHTVMSRRKRGAFFKRVFLTEAGRWREYTSLGWPGPEECQRTRRVDLTTVASTWLAVSAKNIE